VSEVVHRPERRHQCPIGPRTWTHDQAGTVRACETCGRTWVAYRPDPRSGWAPSIVFWRREGWLARRRRERTSRR
jgi:hypothetical protein